MENLPAFDSCDFSKLTVPQLKKLCKNRVTGYSKLAKSALVQKLEEHRQGQRPTAPSLCTRSLPVVLSVVSEDALPQIDISNKIAIDVPTCLPLSPSGSISHQQTTSSVVEEGTRRQLETRPTRLHTLQQHFRTPFPLHEGFQSSITSSSSPSPAVLSAPIRKRSSQRIANLEPSFRLSKRPKLLELNQISLPNTATFKVPALPQRLRVVTPTAVSLHSNNGARRSDQVHPTPTVELTPAPLSPSLDASKPEPKKFVTLIRKDLVTCPGGPKIETKDICYIKEPFCVVEKLPLMTLISIPPTLAQRKLVKSYAVVLQGLSNAERRACAASNRLLRYAGQYQASQY